MIDKEALYWGRRTRMLFATPATADILELVLEIYKGLRSLRGVNTVAYSVLRTVV